MSRVIFHSDANAFYATVECLYNPDLRDKPVAVCGDPEERHGIVLTANRLAKSMGVRTGMANWQAQQVCPELVTVKPDYSLYLHFSEMMRAIYDEYSDHVEAFGLDECWLDMTQPGFTIEDGARVADELRERIKRELGVVTPSTETPVGRLSGGNVQKVLVGREIASSPQVLMVAYPVRGLDINSSYTIYRLLNEQKMKSHAVICVGEDLDVLLALCDRILVLADGKITGIVDARTTTKEEIGLLMTSHGHDDRKTNDKEVTA